MIVTSSGWLRIKVVKRGSALSTKCGTSSPVSAFITIVFEVGARLDSDQFAEVTFLAKSGKGGWKDIGTDDNAPYRVFHDVADIDPGTRVQYRAVVLDNANHTRSSGTDTATIAPPSIALEAPNEGQRVRGEVEVRAVATPDHADYEVTFQRSVNGGAFVDRVTDDSSPVYTLFDDTAGLPDGAQVTYRAVLDYVNSESSLTDANAKRIARELLAADGEEQKLRERTAKKMAGALPAKKAVRFLQIENKLRTLNRYDIAERIPLVK